LKVILRHLTIAKNTNEIKRILHEDLYGISLEPGEDDHARRSVYQTLMARKGGKYEWCRYFGLNIHSWMYRKTIEFRMKEASTDPEDILCWPLWCGWLVDNVTRMTDGEARGVENLQTFTRRWMPPMIADWVDKKMTKKTKETV
jgi:hypothetical protein